MDKIKSLCSAILDTLEQAGEEQWSKTFRFFLSNAQGDPADSKLVRDILAIYKGSNSFNDLVLYNDSKIEICKNTKLDKLQSELFEEAIRLV